MKVVEDTKTAAALTVTKLVENLPAGR